MKVKPIKPASEKYCEIHGTKMACNWQKGAAYKYGGHWRFRCNKCLCEQRKINHPDLKNERRYSDYKYLYGVTKEQHKAASVTQNGICAICGGLETRMMRGKIIPLSIDHCHETGIFRGLLCGNCNSGLGYFFHDIEKLEKAIAYLQKERRVAKQEEP